MKIIILIVSLAITCMANAGKSRIEYSIKSDVTSTKVKAGKCLVYGKILFQGETPLSNVLISTIDHKNTTTSNADGSFSFIINDADSSLFIFKSGYSEIVIPSYDFKSKHAVKIEFYPVVEVEMIEVEKPVIYLYNDIETDVKIKLNPKSKLTFTYPVYDNEWNIKTLKNGNLKLGDRTYPYLFWEGKQNQLAFNGTSKLDGYFNAIDGFLIKTDTCVSFMEKTLTSMGLNSTEKTDFITFWGPRLEQHDYAFIQFIVDDAYSNTIAELEVTPKPTNTKRIFMCFNGSTLKSKFSDLIISPQTFKKVDRKGLTLIEWGGAEIPFTVTNL